MEAVYRCCYGIDVHKKLIVACLKEGGRQELREFGTMTGEIKELYFIRDEVLLSRTDTKTFHDTAARG